MTTGTIVCDVTDPAEGHGAAAFASALGMRLGLRVVLAFIGDDAERDPDQALSTIAEKLHADVEVRLMKGDHAEAIARMAAEEGADLIIVGSRAVGFGGRNLRCTLVRDLEAATPVPVLVAPPYTRRRSTRRLELAAYSETR